MLHQPLAAIHFEKTGDIDALLSDVVSALRANGGRLSGVLQQRGQAKGACYCADMDLVSLSDGQIFRISQPLGEGSQGCRLNPEGLALCSTALARDLEQMPDLLILNRFGKGESEGRGFRDVMSQAILAGIPVLTAVRNTYANDWQAFSGGIASDLPPDLTSVLDWASKIAGLRAKTYAA